MRTDKVVEHMETVLDAAPRDLGYLLRQATYHQMERRPAVALAAATRAVALGNDPRAVSAKITALRELARHDDAKAAAQAQVDAAPSALAHVDLARVYIATGKNDEANATLDRALAIDPGDLMAIDLRWWPVARQDLQRLQLAIPDFEKHAEAHPESAGAWRVLARAWLAIGVSDKALAMFEKAVSLAPGDDDLRAEWWAELLRYQKSAEVLADAEKLGDLRGRDWKLRWNQGEAFGAAGRKMEAQAVFFEINHDDKLHVDVRKRAKRAATAGGAKA